MTRFDRAGSPPPSIKRPSTLGTTCHERPNLSLSQPQLPGSPPSAVRLLQYSSTSACVSHSMKNETDSLNLNCGPALSAMNRWPCNSNTTDTTFSPARFTEMIFDFGKIETYRFIAASAWVSYHRNGVIVGI